MKVTRIKKNTIPICFLPSGRLVCYSCGDVLVMEKDIVLHKISLSRKFKDRILGHCKYFFRFFRMGVRAAIAIDEHSLLLSMGNSIFELCLLTGKLSHGYFCGDGIRPLSFTEVRGLSTINDGIYFGGYLSNMRRSPVSVYRRIGIDNWEKVYTFPEGSINHIHSIIADPYRDCLWIFTGDFGDASAIWRVRDNFNIVERVYSNSQKYRGCIAFAIPEGLLYATDAPFINNHICLLRPNNRIDELQEINGSCIYGCQWKDNYVFSTTVEGDGRNTSRWEFYFGRKRGAGIVDDYVHMYCGNINEGFTEIYKEKKDYMPYYTFQFGVFRFPYGINNSKNLLFQPVATTKNDLCLCAIES